jgi:hypothetical protein
MARDYARLTLDLDPETHRHLKMEAARRGISMRELCLSAIRDELNGDNQPLNWRTDPALAELWDNEDDAIYDELYERRRGARAVPVQRKGRDKAPSGGDS